MQNARPSCGLASDCLGSPRSPSTPSASRLRGSNGCDFAGFRSKGFDFDGVMKPDGDVNGFLKSDSLEKADSLDNGKSVLEGASAIAHRTKRIVVAGSESCGRTKENSINIIVIAASLTD